MSNQSNAAALSAMLDREQIRELVNRYFDCMWQRDIPGALALFAPGGELLLTGSPVDADGNLRATSTRDTVVKGIEAIGALYDKILVATRPVPFGHNTIVNLESAVHATGRTYAELRQADDFSWRGVFTLADEYRKLDGVWKFERRRLTMLHVAPPVATDNTRNFRS